MRNKDIGIVVWGCKGGYRVFCSQGVNVKEKSIIDTIKDIRSFVRFNQVNLTTYALEFTEDYKVFTVYRSCNDSGIGAFVAITIYVPHSLKVQNIRTSLDIAIDSYFKEFIHPVFGTYLDGKYDSIDQYQSLLESLDVVDDLLYDYRPSVQDDCPHLRLYDNISEVDTFFDSPYRKEFFGCQEVMFMSRNLYNSGADSLRFNFKENIIEKVSDPNTPPVISVASTPGVTYFKINDTEYPITTNIPVNILKDEVTIKLKKDYCEDYIISGRIDNLINQNLLFESNKTITIRLSSISWIYKKYDIRFTLNGTFIPDNLIYIEDGKHPIIDHKISIDGSALKTQKKILLRPCSFDTTIVEIGSFVPAKYLNQALDVKLKKHYFLVDISRGVKSEENIFIYPGSGFPTIKIPISSLNENRSLEIYLPEGYVLNDKSFDTKTEYTTIELDGNTIHLIPRELEYDLVLPDIAKEHIKEWDFIINKESRKKKNPFNRDYKVKIDPSERIESGSLYINRDLYDYIIENNSIIPKIVYIRFNDSNCECQTKWLRPNVMVYVNSIFPFTNSTNVKVVTDENKFSLETKIKSLSLIEITIGRKASDTAIQELEGSQQIYNKEVLHENYSAFYVKDKNDKKVSITENTEISLVQSSCTIFNKKDEECCIIYNSKSDYTEDAENFNKQHGFTVSYEDNRIIVKHSEKTICIIVTHSKKTIFSAKQMKSILLGFSGLLIVGLLSFYLYKMLNSGKTPALNVCFEISNNEFHESIKGVKLNNDNDYIAINQDSNVVVEWDSKFGENYEVIVSQSLTLDFGDGMKKEISLSEYRDLVKELETLKLINEKNHIDCNSIHVPVESPLQELMTQVLQSEGKYANNNTDSLYIEYSQFMRKTENKYFHASLLKRAKQMLPEDTIQYDNYLKKFERYKENDTYKDVQYCRDSLANEIKIKQEKKVRVDALRTIANQQKNLLHNLNCTINTVSRVESWYNNLPQEDKASIRSIFNFEKAIADYKVFFAAGSLADIIRLTNKEKGKDSFSTQQWKVILRGYGQNNDTFVNWKREMGMSFSKPYTNSYLK